MNKFSLLLWFYIASIALSGQSISATGNWSETITQIEVIDAGLDIPPTKTSSSNQTTLTTTTFLGWLFAWDWEISVRKIDLNWNNDMDVYIRRTGPGTTLLGGNITGGTNYRRVRTNSTSFFSGNYNRYNVPVQYEIRGLSVLLPAALYSTTIEFTVSSF